MVANDAPRMLFVGVSTKHSLVHQVFDGWAHCLDSKLLLDSRDLALGESRQTYRKLAADLRNEFPSAKGALITSHKAALFNYSADLFDFLSPEAIRLREIGMVYWANGKFSGGANDVLSTQRVTSRLLANSDKWRNGSRQAVILGAGGAGVALASTLAESSEVDCTHITLVESDPARARTVTDLSFHWRSNIPIRVVENAGLSNELVSRSGPGSLIVNATGLGKDKLGSPISIDVDFPPESFVWEFNYRYLPQNTPTFLEIASSQSAAKNLTIEDGWDYFVWGWLGVMSRVLSIEKPLDFYRPCFMNVAEAVRR